MKDLRDHPYIGNPQPGTTSRGFVDGLRSECPKRRDQLASLYGPFIHRIVRNAVRNREDALDLTQTILLEVLNKPGGFRPDGRSAAFRRWVATIALNTSNDHYRKAARSPKAVGGDAVQALEDREENDPELRQAWIDMCHDALGPVRADFHERTFQAAWLVGVERLPVEVVAERLGMSPGAVYTARSRVLKRLKEFQGGNSSGTTAESG